MIVNKKNLKDFKLCGYEGSESVTLRNDEYLLKFINPEHLLQDREKIINALHDFDHPNIVVPEFSLIEKGSFVGYGMKYQKGYKSIGSLITNNIAKIEEFQKRKEAMLKLCEIFEYFDSQKFAYYDLYDDNILYKDGDIKLIDLDGGILDPYINSDLDYNAAIRKSKKQLSIYTLSFLFNLDFMNFHLLMNQLDNKTKEKLYKLWGEDITAYYKYALNYSYSVYYGTMDAINQMTEEMYNDSVDIIKKRLI